MKQDKKTKRYDVCDTFLLRSPLLPAGVLQRISQSSEIDDLLLDQYSRNECLEAIFLSSPGLYRLAQKWIDGGETNKKAKRKLLQYLIRMSSRCTPFGLFAGVCAGQFGIKEGINLLAAGEHSLRFRPDMQLLCLLAGEIGNDREYRKKLKYTPNTSLYGIGGEYRYIEHYSDTEGVRKYLLNATSRTPILQAILDAAADGISIDDLHDLIKEVGTDSKEDTDYLHSLISNQVLVSDLEPTVSGEGFFGELESIISGNEYDNKHVKLFSEISDGIRELNAGRNHERIELIDAMNTKVKQAGLKFSESAFVQADMKLAVRNCQLSDSIRKDLLVAINFLTRLSRAERNPLLERFKNNFYKRYGDREIPLSLVMDAEAGPAYLPEDGNEGNSSILAGLKLPPKKQLTRDLKWLAVDSMLYSKHQQALMTGQYEVKLSESDLEKLPVSDHEISKTISMLVRILGKWEMDSHKRIIQLISAGGNSAINLAGRFAYLDESLGKCLKEVGRDDRELNADAVLAEIIHLPEERTGNVLLRPVMHEYEIPYLAKTSVDQEYSLPVTDLMVRVKDDKILLRSKKLNRYILPRLSNAHNYMPGRLSMYRFLCDMQSQDLTTNLSFSWGPLEQDSIFLPRVSFKNIILKPAQWNLQNQDLDILKGAKDDIEFNEALNMMRKKFNIPNEILLTEFDNELWLDLSSNACRDILLHEVRKRDELCIKEYLSQGSDALVRSADGNHTNEFLFFLYERNNNEQ